MLIPTHVRRCWSYRPLLQQLNRKLISRKTEVILDLLFFPIR